MGVGIESINLFDQNCIKVYDIVVPKEYNFGGPEKDSNPLHIVYLIDITENSMKQNLPILITDAIRATLFSYNNSSEDATNGCNHDRSYKTKVAIIAFDKRIHFFNLSSSLETTQISISPDLEDLFVPFSEGLFVDPEE